MIYTELLIRSYAGNLINVSITFVLLCKCPLFYCRLCCVLVSHHAYVFDVVNEQFYMDARVHH